MNDEGKEDASLILRVIISIEDEVRGAKSRGIYRN